MATQQRPRAEHPLPDTVDELSWQKGCGAHPGFDGEVGELEDVGVVGDEEEDAVEEDARSCSGSVDSARRKTRPRGLHPRAQYSERRQGTVARRRPFSGELGD
jgi:hypothetical protein